MNLKNFFHIYGQFSCFFQRFLASFHWFFNIISWFSNYCQFFIQFSMTFNYFSFYIFGQIFNYFLKVFHDLRWNFFHLLQISVNVFPIFDDFLQILSFLVERVVWATENEFFASFFLLGNGFSYLIHFSKFCFKHYVFWVPRGEGSPKAVPRATTVKPIGIAHS